MIIRGEITQEKLQHIYNTIQRIIKDENCYYTEKQIEEIKRNKSNVIWEMGDKNDI